MKKGFIVKAIFFSLILSTICFFWNYFLPQKYTFPHALYAIMYFLISTTLFHQMTIKANEKSAQHFVRMFIVTTAIRMLLGLTILLIYALMFKAAAMKFALLFLLLYFFYLIFEVVLLLKHFQSSPSGKAP